MTPQQLRAQAVTVSYGQLSKDPDSFQGTFTKFTGQILQIEQSGSTGIMRLSVTNEGYGIWSPNDVVYVEYNQPTQAVQDDVVTVYGMLNGTQTYTSEANYQISLPDMVACAIGAIPAPASSTSANTNATEQTPSAAVPAAATVSPAQSSTPPGPAYTTPSDAPVSGSGNPPRNSDGTIVQLKITASAEYHNIAFTSQENYTNCSNSLVVISVVGNQQPTFTTYKDNFSAGINLFAGDQHSIAYGSLTDSNGDSLAADINSGMYGSNTAGDWALTCDQGQYALQISTIY
jgi:hypothetical protein